MDRADREPSDIAEETGGTTVSSRHSQGARRVAEAQARYLRGKIIEPAASDDEDGAADIHA